MRGVQVEYAEQSLPIHAQGQFPAAMGKLPWPAVDGDCHGAGAQGKFTGCIQCPIRRQVHSQLALGH